MYVPVALVMLIVWLFPKFTKVIPGSLADISGTLPMFHLPDAPLSVETLTIVLPYSLIIALVGLIESLLTLAVLDEMYSKKDDCNKECVAQGVGNTICGFFGSFTGCAMIGQSVEIYCPVTFGGTGGHYVCGVHQHL